MKLIEAVKLMSGPDRLYIETEDKEEIYRGYQGNWRFSEHEDLNDKEVVKIGLFTEIFRKELRQEKMASTYDYTKVPDMISDLRFSDLEYSIYQRITIKK